MGAKGHRKPLAQGTLKINRGKEELFNKKCWDNWVSIENRNWISASGYTQESTYIDKDF